MTKSTETQLAVVDPQEYGLEVAKAQQINESFLPKLAERDGLIQVYENILIKEITKDVCNEAATLRKKLVKVRTGIAEIHKVEKAFYLASGRYVDALKNKHTLPIEQMEEKLAEVEKYYETIEAERIAKLQSEREGMLLAYEVENVSALNLGVMTDEIWNGFLTGTKTTYEAKKAAEAKAEADRIESERLEQVERERVAKENEALRLKLEAQEKAAAAEKAKADAILKAEQDKAAAELKAANDKAEKERATQAKIQAEKDAEAARLKAIADAETKRIADELQAEKDRQAKVLADQQAADLKAQKEAEKLAKAPIKNQLAVWVKSFELPATIENETAKEITAKFNSFKVWAAQQVESL